MKPRRILALPYIFALLLGCNTGEKRAQSSLVENSHKKWLKGDIRDVEIMTVETESSKPIKIPLNVIKNRDSSWSNEDIVLLVKEAQKIFDQCSAFDVHISLFPVRLIEIDHPRLNQLHYRDDYLFTRDLPEDISKPVAVFTEKSKYSWGGYSNRAEVLKDEKKKVSYGVVFVLKGVFKMRGGKHDYFFTSILAHEILHILLEEEPNNLTGNILNHDLDTGGDSLTKEQCKKIADHPFVVKN